MALPSPDHHGMLIADAQAILSAVVVIHLPWPVAGVVAVIGILVVGSLAGPAVIAAPASLVLGALLGLIVGAAVGFGADMLDSALTPRANQ